MIILLMIGKPNNNQTFKNKIEPQKSKTLYKHEQSCSTSLSHCAPPDWKIMNNDKRIFAVWALSVTHIFHLTWTFSANRLQLSKVSSGCRVGLSFAKHKTNQAPIKAHNFSYYSSSSFGWSAYQKFKVNARSFPPTPGPGGRDGRRKIDENTPPLRLKITILLRRDAARA